MVEIIAEELFLMLNEYTCKYAEEYAKNLLYKIEEAGMRPPVKGSLKSQLNASILGKWEDE